MLAAAAGSNDTAAGSNDTAAGSNDTCGNSTAQELLSGDKIKIRLINRLIEIKHFNLIKLIILKKCSTKCYIDE